MSYREDHYSVWLESPSVPIKILFARERAQVWGVFFARRSAPLNEELRHWKPAQKVLIRIGERVDFTPLRGKPYGEQVAGSLRILAQAIEPVFARTCEIVEGDEPQSGRS